jgi:hypothetical protein
MIWPQMNKSQYRNMRNMKNQANITPPKVNNSIIMGFNDGKVYEITKNQKK